MDCMVEEESWVGKPSGLNAMYVNLVYCIIV